jgi:hypothetical protein
MNNQSVNYSIRTSKDAQVAHHTCVFVADQDTRPRTRVNN